MNKKIFLNVLPWIALVLVLVFLVVIPNFSESKINEGKDLGKIELIDDILINGRIPTGYTYCPNIEWDKLEEDLYRQIEPSIYANESSKIEMDAKEEEIQRQIKEVLKPVRNLCGEMDLVISMDLMPNLQEEQNKGYQQAISEIQQNYNCVVK